MEILFTLSVAQSTELDLVSIQYGHAVRATLMTKPQPENRQGDKS